MDKTVPQQALDLLKQGGLRQGPDWTRAHELCQTGEGQRGHDLVHALCHWIEGDLSNRDYWYRRVAGWQRADTIAAEWTAIASALASA